jgi:hypothetical protein
VPGQQRPVDRETMGLMEAFSHVAHLSGSSGQAMDEKAADRRTGEEERTLV